MNLSPTAQIAPTARLFAKPNGIFALDYVDPITGARRRVSTGERDRRRARQVALGLLHHENLPPVSPAGRPENRQPARVTIDAMFRQCELDVWSLRRCRSQRTIKSNLKVLRAVRIAEPDGREVLFASLAVAEVTADRLRRLAAALRRAGYAESTVKRKMDMVGRALTEASDAGVIVGRPKMPKMDKTPPRARVLTLREEALAFAAIDKRAAGEPRRDWRRTGYLFKFLLEMGTRLGETLHAREGWCREVPLGAEGEPVWCMEIPAWATKSNRPRTLPLTPAVVAMLPWLRERAEEATDGRPGRRLFPYLPGGPWYRWTNIRDDLAADGVDVSDVVIHTFRHTCLTRMHEREVPIDIISKWAGHSSVAITESVYVKYNANTLRRALHGTGPVLEK